MKTKYLDWKNLPEETDIEDPYSWTLREGGPDGSGFLRRKDQYSIVHWRLDMPSEEVYLLPDHLSKYIELAKAIGRQEIKDSLKSLILH